jgi:predicted membrane protein
MKARKKYIMKKLLKTIGLLAFVSAVAALVYNIIKAVNLKNQDESLGLDDVDENSLIRKCIFDGIDEEIDVSGKESLSLICHFGGMNLSLSEAENVGDKLIVDLDVSFGGIDLTLPKTWEVINETSCIVGGTDIEDCELPDDCSTLILTGKILIGGMDINYKDSED